VPSAPVLRVVAGYAGNDIGDTSDMDMSNTFAHGQTIVQGPRIIARHEDGPREGVRF
jgi:hypothetical protein